MILRLAERETHHDTVGLNADDQSYRTEARLRGSDLLLYLQAMTDWKHHRMDSLQLIQMPDVSLIRVKSLISDLSCAGQVQVPETSR